MYNYVYIVFITIIFWSLKLLVSLNNNTYNYYILQNLKNYHLFANNITNKLNYKGKIVRTIHVALESTHTFRIRRVNNNISQRFVCKCEIKPNLFGIFANRSRNDANVANFCIIFYIEILII